MVLFLIITVIYIKIFAVGLGILGTMSFVFGIFYNKIGDYLRKNSEFCAASLLRKTIFKPKQKNKENDINLEEGKNNLIEQNGDRTK